MEWLNALTAWYHSSGLSLAKITIPAAESTILFFLLTICLLFRFSRTGLIVAYLFVYRWGWSMRDQQGLSPELHTFFTSGYIICGIVVFALAAAGMIYASHKGND